MQQLTLQIEPGAAQRYRSLLECLSVRVHDKGLTRVAGELDVSPSHLSEALSCSERDRHSNGRRKFGVDDLERYMRRTGDLEPLYYLLDAFLRDPATQQAEALAKLSRLAEELPALLAAAGINGAGKRRR